MPWQFLNTDDRQTLTAALAGHSLITSGSTGRVVLLSQAGLSEYTASLGTLANSSARMFAGELITVLEQGGWQSDPPRHALAALLDYFNILGDTHMSARELFARITSDYGLYDADGRWRHEGQEIERQPKPLTLDRVAALVAELQGRSSSPPEEILTLIPSQLLEPELLPPIDGNGYQIRIGKFAILAEEYAAFLVANPLYPRPTVGAGWSGHNPLEEIRGSPVMGTSYDDAEAYCQWLRKVTGRQYRLPTVDEWRRGCRSREVEIAENVSEWTSSTDSAGNKDNRAGQPATRRILCKLSAAEEGETAVKCFPYLARLSGKTFTFRVLLESRS